MVNSYEGATFVRKVVDAMYDYDVDVALDAALYLSVIQDLAEREVTVSDAIDRIGDGKVVYPDIPAVLCKVAVEVVLDRDGFASHDRMAVMDAYDYDIARAVIKDCARTASGLTSTNKYADLTHDEKIVVVRQLACRFVAGFYRGFTSIPGWTSPERDES